VPSPTGALPPSTVNTVFLSPKKPVVSFVPPVVKPPSPRLCLEAARLDGFLGESRDEKIIGDSRLVALVESRHPKTLLTPFHLDLTRGFQAYLESNPGPLSASM
jgi:hypothetical protein